VVIPNTYGRPERSAGHEEVGDPPTILLQGSLNYGPNMDAVEWLIGEVAPKLWERVPGAEIRLVGNPAPGVQRWDRPPAVTVVGKVPDMVPELARADIAVVPLRIGSGTRLKILESFAHRIPVVSTTLGADGLDVRDGVHLLLADTPDDFAAACQRLLSDMALRKRMVDAAEALFLRRYEWSATRDHIQRLVREVAGRTTSGG
jgi:glycosyltransferase involved in cell wall biosynthesis